MFSAHTRGGNYYDFFSPLGNDKNTVIHINEPISFITADFSPVIVETMQTSFISEFDHLRV